MHNGDLKVVYMGTPEFAVGPLEAIVKNGFDVVGVVTVPDKPAGRGRKLRTSAVKDYAVNNRITVLQPEKLRDPQFISDLQALNADVFVVVAFRMLPEIVWQIPSLGTFNLHASLLPQYRGAAPINWAVINGETESGVTTFMIDSKIDTGNVLLQDRISLLENETAGSLHDKLKDLGSNLVVRTLEELHQGSIVPKQQEESSDLKAAPKIFKEDCQINWNQPGMKIEAMIRGLSPYPGAFTTIESDEFSGTLKITNAVFEPGSGGPEAEMRIQGKQLVIVLADGRLILNQIQPQGKRSMSAKDFINGIREKDSTFKVI